MKITTCLIFVLAISFPLSSAAQECLDAEGQIRVAIVKQPYSGSRNVPELSQGPEVLASSGIKGILENLGCSVTDCPMFYLTNELT